MDHRARRPVGPRWADVGSRGLEHPSGGVRGHRRGTARPSAIMAASHSERSPWSARAARRRGASPGASAVARGRCQNHLSGRVALTARACSASHVPAGGGSTPPLLPFLTRQSKDADTGGGMSGHLHQQKKPRRPSATTQSRRICRIRRSSKTASPHTDSVSHQARARTRRRRVQAQRRVRVDGVCDHILCKNSRQQRESAVGGAPTCTRDPGRDTQAVYRIWICRRACAPAPTTAGGRAGERSTSSEPCADRTVVAAPVTGRDVAPVTLKATVAAALGARALHTKNAAMSPC